MDLTSEYLSKICPELLESEIKVLKDNLLDLYSPDEIYPQVVRVTADKCYGQPKWELLITNQLLYH